MAPAVDIDQEVYELRGVFPDVDRDSFYKLDNGNIGVIVYYNVEECPIDEFEVLIEFPQGYPNVPPEAWIMNPEIPEGAKHAWGADEHGHTKICYLDPNKWQPQLTSYDAATMIKSWIFAYCNWLNTGNWSWEEEIHSDLGDLLSV